MAVRRTRSNRRPAPYPPRRPVATPTISSLTPIDALTMTEQPPVGGPKATQGALDRHEALRQAPIGKSTEPMFVRDPTTKGTVPIVGPGAPQAGDGNFPWHLYDVDPSESAFGVPSKADLKFWTRSAASFIRSSSAIDATWVGRRPLGQGSFGIAGVWEKYDHNGNMIDVRQSANYS